MRTRSNSSSPCPSSPHAAESRPTRRTFVQSLVAAGASLAATGPARAQTASTTQPATAPATQKLEPLNLALIGVGRWGAILLELLAKLPQVRLQALCDMGPYGRRLGLGRAKAAGHTPAVYEDHRTLLETEKGLHAVVIALPDFWHAPASIDCLKAGLHVYCETPMADTPAAARQMVQVARQTGKLLQIGNFRRSIPLYQLIHDLIQNDHMIGDERSVRADWFQDQNILPVPPMLINKYPLSDKLLETMGYASVQQWFHWSWYRKYAMGGLTCHGAQQLDALCWLLEQHPAGVMALAADTEVQAQARIFDIRELPEHPDHITAIYRWDKAKREILGTLEVNRVLNLSSGREVVIGDQGLFSFPKPDSGEAKVEYDWIKNRVAPWGSEIEEVIKSRYGNWINFLSTAPRYPDDGPPFDDGLTLRSRGFEPSTRVRPEALQAMATKSLPQWHVENFLTAVRGLEPLTCSAETAFPTFVAAFAAGPAAKVRQWAPLLPQDLKA